MNFTASTRLNPAEDLLAAVLASRWNPARIGDLAILADGCAFSQWNKALRYHGLAGVLVKQHPDQLEMLPEAFQSCVHELHKRHATRALMQFKVLADAVSAMTKADISCLPLKGLVLSEHLYGNLAVRQSGDIDVLISPNRFDAAYHALVHAGFRPEFEYVPNHRVCRYLQWSTHHMGWHAPSGDRVELHWRTEPNAGHAQAPLDQLLDELFLLEISGQGFLRFNDEIWLNSLAIHAERDSCQRWKWGHDVLQMISVQDPDHTPWESPLLHQRHDAVSRVVYLMAKQLGQHIEIAPRQASIAERGGAFGVEYRHQKMNSVSRNGQVTQLTNIKRQLVYARLSGGLYAQAKDLFRNTFSYVPLGSEKWVRVVACLPILSIVIRAWRGFTRRRPRSTLPTQAKVGN